MRFVGNILRLLIILFSGAIVFLLALLAILIFVQVPIDLTGQKSLFETIAGNALDRNVTIEGRIEVTTSLHPSFAINGVRIDNPDGFDEKEYIFIQTAKIQLRILPLLRGKIYVHEFNGKGIRVTLLENKQGMNNWSTASPEKPAPPVAPQERNRLFEMVDLTPDVLVIDRLVFSNIALLFRTPDMPEPVTFTIDKCTGSVQPGIPTSLTLDGSWQTHPFTSEIRVGSLQELIQQDRSWIHIATDIAGTNFEFEGTVNLVTVLDSLNLKAAMRGEQLDSLNELLQLELPPLQAYEASADLTLRKKILNLNKLQLKFGDSLLECTMVIDAQGERPVVSILMTAPLIQINDFNLNDLDVEQTLSKEPAERVIQEDIKDLAEQPDTPDAENDGYFGRLLSQEIFKQFDSTITVQFNRVLSGKDTLGGGELKAVLKDGRFSIDPLQLDIPGGALFYAMSFEPGEETARATLRIIAENFDFGVLARRAKPETDMGGTINLDIDLQSSGGSFEEILANGNGYVDFSARPVNLNSGIMDLWVVNLLAAILFRSNKEGSPVNCLISRWSMSDGVLAPDAFAVDTGSMRICGTGTINLKDNTINLRIAPTPKRKQFISLATPFAVQGKITDIEMEVAPGGFIGTSIHIMASPLTTPLSWFLGQKLPADGSDICSLPIGAAERPKKKLPGCR